PSPSGEPADNIWRRARRRAAASERAAVPGDAALAPACLRPGRGGYWPVRTEYCSGADDAALRGRGPVNAPASQTAATPANGRQTRQSRLVLSPRPGRRHGCAGPRVRRRLRSPATRSPEQAPRTVPARATLSATRPVRPWSTPAQPFARRQDYPTPLADLLRSIPCDSGRDREGRRNDHALVD